MQIIDNTLIKAEQSDVKNDILSIPEGVTALESGCIDGVTFKELNLPSTLKELKFQSLRGITCKKLRIPQSVEEINMFAFDANTALEEISFYGSQKGLVSARTLIGCYALRNIKIGLNNYPVVCIGKDIYTVLEREPIKGGYCLKTQEFMWDEIIYTCIPNTPNGRLDYFQSHDKEYAIAAFEMHHDTGSWDKRNHHLTIDTQISFVEYISFGTCSIDTARKVMQKSKNSKWTDTMSVRDFILQFHDTAFAQIVANQYQARHERIMLANRYVGKEEFIKILMDLN